MMARVRFLLFCAIVLGLPGGLMALKDPRIGDLGKLAMILSPAIAGLALNPGLGRRGERICWREVGRAALVTLIVAHNGTIQKRLETITSDLEARQNSLAGMLGDITPRAAVQTAAGRHRVAGWLKHLENRSSSQLDANDPIATYDFTWMWRELGIENLRK